MKLGKRCGRGYDLMGQTLVSPTSYYLPNNSTNTDFLQTDGIVSPKGMKMTLDKRKRRPRALSQKARKMQLTIRLTFLLLVPITIAAVNIIFPKYPEQKTNTAYAAEKHDKIPKKTDSTPDNSNEDSVLGDLSQYPESMLKALERNPEILDFVLKYPDTDAVPTGGFSKKEKKETYPLLIQWDARWGYAPYGNDNIGISGCGPTCLSMVIYSLTKNEEATPNAIADFSMAGGYYVSGTGTAWTLMTDAPAQYGIKTTQIPLEEPVMADCLNQGQMLICSVGAGDFTDQGHFIVIYGYNEEGFLINDPFSHENSSKAWSFQTLQTQIWNIWAYSL